MSQEEAIGDWDHSGVTFCMIYVIRSKEYLLRGTKQSIECVFLLLFYHFCGCLITIYIIICADHFPTTISWEQTDREGEWVVYCLYSRTCSLTGNKKKKKHHQETKKGNEVFVSRGREEKMKMLVSLVSFNSVSFFLPFFPQKRNCSFIVITSLEENSTRRWRSQLERMR